MLTENNFVELLHKPEVLFSLFSDGDCMSNLFIRPQVT